jgi:hypothetical protein
MRIAPTPPTDTRPSIRLLGTQPDGNTVEVTLTGTPTAVVTTARTIAAALPVLGMQHTPTAQDGRLPRIVLVLTVRPPKRGRS